MVFLLLKILYYFTLVLIFGNVIMSWVPSLRENSLGQWIYERGERVLQPFRRLIPSGGGLDFSPMIAYIVVQICYSVLVSFFTKMGTL